MEIYQLKNVSFSYPNQKDNVLEDINLTIKAGEFVTVCGKSGCGKTTLLRLLKPLCAPVGNMRGEILFGGKSISEITQREQTVRIGLVMQDPESQIVTDKVWHELAFGLESLGLDNTKIRTRVSETASFFGIQNWFYKKTSDLSGGQKQLLSLAAVMVMQPDVLILDEPTSQLDPIAASEFINLLKKINGELGTTVIIAEHRLDEVLEVSDRVIVADGGKITADCAPRELCAVLKNHDMYAALPVPVRVFGALADGGECPLTVREGKTWLEEFAREHSVDESVLAEDTDTGKADTAIEVREVYFRYEKDLPYTVKNLNLTVYKGEIFALLGGNGTGKTTAVSLISGLNRPQRGKIRIDGTDISKIPDLYSGLIGVLAQNVQNLFVHNTLFADLFDMTDKDLPRSERESRLHSAAELCRIGNLLYSHPYDLSGGEQQRAALAMVLLRRPRILLLDEPTKGMDAHFKLIFVDVLRDLKASGVTVFMVSHDIEFCAELADRCALFFDGGCVSCAPTREFFRGNRFYTTSAHRMARQVTAKAVLADDIVRMFGKSISTDRRKESYTYDIQPPPVSARKKSAVSPARIAWGVIFALCFAAVCAVRGASELADTADYITQALSILFAALGIVCFFPQREIASAAASREKCGGGFAKRAAAAAVMMLAVIPLTIAFGIYRLGDRKYYFISLLIILETFLPFCMTFENRKPKAREIVVISTLCAIAVAGRCAFFMLPEFKPVAAAVIISGVCFGGETGFLVGAVAGFVSNFFFGQGPWTPWQMFAFGIVGFFGGAVFKNGILPKTRLSLAVYGFLAVLAVYGGIMNVASVLMATAAPTPALICSAIIAGLPVDMVHALSTVFFLWFCAEPMIEKLERIKVKYGLIER